jgi:hypothetical protein
VAKRRFLVFAQGTRFEPEKQSRVLLAFAVIFNFLAIHDPENNHLFFNPEQNWLDWDFDTATGLDEDDIGDEGVMPGPASLAETMAAEAKCKEIAQAMWASYLAVKESNSTS